jgi:hypothetical protein
MKFVNGFFRIWLVLCFALTFFAIPLYLLAIYPEIPPNLRQIARGMGITFGTPQPSLIGFTLRVIYSGCVIALGCLVVASWLRDNEPKRQA